MNLYEYCYNYLIQQTKNANIGITRNDLNKYFKCDLYSWKPYFTATEGQETKKDVMKMFAFILQNRFILPKIIDFCGNYNKISEILHNFDDEYIRNHKDDIKNEIIQQLSNNKNIKTWNSYINGLIDSAEYFEIF